jgi:hypothetical protein
MKIFTFRPAFPGAQPSSAHGTALAQSELRSLEQMGLKKCRLIYINKKYKCLLSSANMTPDQKMKQSEYWQIWKEENRK